MLTLVGLAFVFVQEEKIRVVRLADSIASGSSTEPSVNGCSQSGKESPSPFAEVDWCLVTAATGTWFSDLHSHMIPPFVRDGGFPVIQKNKKAPLFRTTFPTTALLENRPPA